MRKLLFTITTTLMLSSALLAQDDADAIVSFLSKQIHLGKVVKGEQVKNVFTLTNISDQEVVIDLVSTCECTKAKWPTTPIAPGDTVTIDFIFDSTQKDEEEEIQLDVYFLNVNPVTDAPYSAYLAYTYDY